MRTDNMANYLIEISLAELPIDAVKTLSSAWKDAMTNAFAEANLTVGDIKSYATPRRLALQLIDAQTQQADIDIEKRGPALKAAKDDGGNWTKAAQGFARSCGVAPEDLIVEPTPKGDWLFFRGTEAGKSTAALLPEMVETTLQKLPIAKRMRWGDAEHQFVRPVLSYVLMQDDTVIDAEFMGVKSGNMTFGHRVHGDKTLTIASATSYEQQLGDSFVFADIDARRAKIKADSDAVAQSIGGSVIWDEDTLDEVTALTEYPVAMLGEFDKVFLDLPKEVLIMTMQAHQKYFPIADANGALLPNFIVTANIDSNAPEKVVAGNRCVIEARFADAKFFWDNDLKSPLIERLPKLANVTYRDKLGTLADRVARIEQIAVTIAAASGANVEHVKRACQLSKCDLVTDMVFEFGELQGVMGRYYAQQDGEAMAVADAMVEQYLPKFAGDALPESDIGLCLSAAEKVETMLGGFAVGAKPTGTKDPYAIRRNALGLIRLLNETSLDMPLHEIFSQSAAHFDAELNAASHVEELVAYCDERLKGYTADKGIRHDVFDAVLAQKTHDITVKDCVNRLTALQDFLTHADANNLFAANKRASNILKKAENVTNVVDTSLQSDSAEKALYAALESVKSRVSEHVNAKAYTDAFTALAELRTPLDDFFDNVMVMDDNPAIQVNRLALLQQLRDCAGQVADLSLIDTSSV